MSKKMDVSQKYDKIALIAAPWPNIELGGHEKEMAIRAPTATLEALRELSNQNIFISKLHTTEIVELNRQFGKKLLFAYETKLSLTDEPLCQQPNNELTLKLNEFVYSQTMTCFRTGRLPFILGGSSHVSFPAIEAATKKTPLIDVLHISGYQNLYNYDETPCPWHERSAIYNIATKLTNIRSINQVGIRRVATKERTTYNSLEKDQNFSIGGGMLDGVGKNTATINVFNSNYLKTQMFHGKSWHDLCNNILSKLVKPTWISIDLSAFKSLADNFQMLPPSGLEYEEVLHLLRTFFNADKEIVGIDIVNNYGTSKDIKFCAHLLLDTLGAISSASDDIT